MSQSRSMGGMSMSGYPGEDFVCRTCGCEVMVKHWGEPRSHAESGTLVCHCGREMEPEHPGEVGQMREGHGAFDQEDFLGHGGGAGEAAGMGRTSSTGSSPGGGR